MPLHPKQETLLRLFFPGLVEAVEALGEGEYEAQCPKLSPAKSGVYSVHHRLTKTFADGKRLSMTVRWRIATGSYQLGKPVVPTEWVAEYFSYVYSVVQGERLFAVDYNYDESEPHVHLPPNVNEHVRPAAVDPSVSRSLDPRQFAEFVAFFRTTGRYPLKRKRTK